MDKVKSSELPTGFSSEMYLKANPDVASAGMDAVEHYLLHGKDEGRPLFPKHERPREHIERALGKAASDYGVMPLVHAEDHLLSHLLGVLPNADRAAHEYFADGRESAEMFAALLAQYPTAKTVLEFASGYGRMTRHVKNVAPNISLTVCDIHPEANRFITETMGIPSIASTSAPEQFSADREYDFTFALSLFSHLPKHTWTRWLRALVHTVRPDGGIVAFTTHGRMTARNQGVTLDPGAFVFRGVSEQADIDIAEYGTTYVTAKYAFEQINSLGNARILDFSEAHWWGHQDIYVIQRTGG